MVVSRQRREQTPTPPPPPNQQHPQAHRRRGGGERQRTSRDPRARVLQVETLLCATWLLLAGNCLEQRAEESLVAMETTARRDAEMEGDVRCLQRWTNIFVGKHKKWLGLPSFLSFFLSFVFLFFEVTTREE